MIMSVAIEERFSCAKTMTSEIHHQENKISEMKIERR